MNSQIMGIINVTSDSFWAPSRVQAVDEALARAQQLIDGGVDILDVGGESTRPGATQVSEEEELARVIPVIQEIRKVSSIPISIDTSKPEVARRAVAAGASLINDITGFCNQEMIEVARCTEADLCVMHMQGTPQTMQHNPWYAKGVVPETIEWLQGQAQRLLEAGIARERIIIDPGIGFGKTLEDNRAIIRNIAQYKALGFRVLVGVSRKSCIARILGKGSDELLAGTLAVNAFLILSGVDIIRVHDVQEHRDLCTALRFFS